MAEEKKDIKKDDKKPESKPSGTISWEEVLLLILGIIALLFVFIPRFFPQDNNNDSNQVNSSFNIKQTYNRLFNEQNQNIIDSKGQVIDVVKSPSLIEESKSRLTDIFSAGLLIVYSLLIFLILLFSSIIYYNKFRRELIIKSYRKKFETEEEIKEEFQIDKNNINILENSNTEPDDNDLTNPRWEMVMRYFNSANQSDWKLSIIEADIMLYELLNRSGFKGDSIGEMLKNTDKSKLQTLDLAWSAHKVRNQIAHSGLDYILPRDLVERTIDQYKKVFDEMHYI